MMLNRARHCGVRLRSKTSGNNWLIKWNNFGLKSRMLLCTQKFNLQGCIVQECLPMSLQCLSEIEFHNLRCSWRCSVWRHQVDQQIQIPWNMRQDRTMLKQSYVLVTREKKDEPFTQLSCRKIVYSGQIQWDLKTYMPYWHQMEWHARF